MREDSSNDYADRYGNLDAGYAGVDGETGVSWPGVMHHDPSPEQQESKIRIQKIREKLLDNSAPAILPPSNDRMHSIVPPSEWTIKGGHMQFTQGSRVRQSDDHVKRWYFTSHRKGDAPVFGVVILLIGDSISIEPDLIMDS
jgi:hypothetical protein